MRDLGVIEDLRLIFGRGMTALTGETGAGKTMVVEAIELLVGGRADADLVRPHAQEAVVEGRFHVDGDELVLTRVIPRQGRSRAYVDGRMATAAALEDHGSRIVDLHGQHAHQSLLRPSVQRDALDRFGGIDQRVLEAARHDVRRLEGRIDGLGGDAGARAREVDLLRFQVDELDRARVDGPDEDDRLDEQENALADAVGHRLAASRAAASLADEGGALDSLAAAEHALDGRGPFSVDAARLRSLAAELADAAAEIRTRGERIEEDPERLEQLRTRRQLLADLRRKYGTAATGDRQGSLAGVLAYADEARERLRTLLSHDEIAAGLERELAAAEAAAQQAAAAVGRDRRTAAPKLARAVQAHLRELAMPRAEMTIDVGDDDPGDQVEFLLRANPGSPALPLAKAASGGELARAMLALRLVLSTAPPILIFDEVDAGIGGEAALMVGRALAALGGEHQVLVVTHLPQVAAFADAQVAVSKVLRAGTTVARAETLGAEERVVELSRMLSGTPESATAREHATELLSVASQARGR
ncbi:MAG: DNA repair protein RecN [Actinomycetota bacterium]|nr:DNA repair protein RecN [Actinomycetota bacterium]